MPLRRFKAIVLLLCAACLLLSGWMLFHSLSGVQLAGCGAGSSCDSVMGSPWAYFLGGVPVSLPAMAVYLLLALCTAFLEGKSADSASLDRLLWRLLPLLSGCIVGAALWFGYLQGAVLHTFCKYCTALHLLGCAAAAFILFCPPRPERKARLPWMVIGLTAAALFAVIQSRTLPDAVYDRGRSDAPLPAFTDEELPSLGRADAPETLTLLFDFQCTHCRRLHKLLPELLSAGKYRIRLCPVPLSSACNPYIPHSGIDRFAGSCELSRLALAVWYARPEAYEAYWDALFEDGTDPENLARELLGTEYEKALADARIKDCLRKAYELFGRTSSSAKSGVPRFILGQNWVVPEVETVPELQELIGHLAEEF